MRKLQSVLMILVLSLAFIPAANAKDYDYSSKASNGTTSVDLVDAATNYSIVVKSVFIVNSSSTNGYSVKLCDGACSSSNFIVLPAPKAEDSSVGGAIAIGGEGGIGFDTSKSTKLSFSCATNCSTNVQVSVTYELEPRR